MRVEALLLPVAIVGIKANDQFLLQPSGGVPSASIQRGPTTLDKLQLDFGSPEAVFGAATSSSSPPKNATLTSFLHPLRNSSKTSEEPITPMLNKSLMKPEPRSEINQGKRSRGAEERAQGHKKENKHYTLVYKRTEDIGKDSLPRFSSKDRDEERLGSKRRQPNKKMEILGRITHQRRELLPLAAVEENTNDLHNSYSSSQGVQSFKSFKRTRRTPKRSLKSSDVLQPSPWRKYQKKATMKTKMNFGNMNSFGGNVKKGHFGGKRKGNYEGRDVTSDAQTSNKDENLEVRQYLRRSQNLPDSVNNSLFKEHDVKKRDTNSNLAFMAFLMALLDTVVNIVSIINDNNNNNNNNNNDNNNNNNNANVNDLVAMSENMNMNMVTAGKSLFQRVSRFMKEAVAFVTSPFTSSSSSSSSSSSLFASATSHEASTSASSPTSSSLSSSPPLPNLPSEDSSSHFPSSSSFYSSSSSSDVTGISSAGLTTSASSPPSFSFSRTYTRKRPVAFVRSYSTSA